MVGKFTVANAESFQRKKKRNKEEMDAEGPTLQSQKHLMQDIEYKSTGAEKYQWQPVEFDAKLLGPKADLTGFFGLQKISGDQADKLLKEFGKDGPKSKKKNKKAKVLQLNKQPTEDDGEPKQKKKKASNADKQISVKAGKETAATQAAQDEGQLTVTKSKRKGAKQTDKKQAQREAAEADLDGEDEEPAEAAQAEARQPSGPKTKRGGKAAKKRKRGKKAEDDGEDDAEEAMEGGEGDEGGGGGAEQAGEGVVAAVADKDYDDEYEYKDWGGIMLRGCLVKALTDLGFHTPTAIQQAVVPVAMAKRADLFGAAETGSGKTLAFGLPLLQRILESSAFTGVGSKERHLAGLIISPTRELALQVRDHLAAAARYTAIKVVAVVGGLAVQKQDRLLAQHPHIVVGTPGRLWEQMQHGGGYLTQLHMLLCLVIDEADRMLETGHFEELENILRLLPVVDPSKRSKRKQDAKANNKVMETQRKQAWGRKGRMQGGRPEEKRESEEEWTEEEEEEEAVEALTTFRSEKTRQRLQEAQEEQAQKHSERHYRRQTLIFSATLIKDTPWRAQGKGQKEKEKREERKGPDKLREESVARLVARLQLPEHPTVIDLCPQGRVAHKIEQHRLECVATDKDVMVYHALLQHLQAGGGRAMVFANAIGEARRLAGTLNLLRVKAVVLHSGLQQRQRLKHLDMFKAHPSAVLIATDVAARGLDIPAVEFVIHYHVPKVPSVYVHRCGRSARGSALVGRSLLLMSPAEHWHYSKITDILGDEIPLTNPNGQFLQQAEKRVVTAKKLEAELNKATNEARDQTWMAKQAEALEVDLDEEEMDEEDVLLAAQDGGRHRKGGGPSGGGNKARRVRELEEALGELLDAHMLPKGVSPKFVAGGGTRPGQGIEGLPELIGHGATKGSLGRGYANGRRLHRKKPKFKFKK